MRVLYSYPFIFFADERPVWRGKIPTNWTMERLPRVSLTILRLAVAEMLFGGENKPGVAINEAVELTKKYGADEDYQFVNGLLGAVARDHGLDAEQAEQ